MTLRGPEPGHAFTANPSGSAPPGNTPGAESGAVPDVARLRAFAASLAPAERDALLGILAADLQAPPLYPLADRS